MNSARRKWSTTREKGSLIVLVAIILPVLIAMLGLVVDNGFLLKTKREMQSAADAAAVAAAHELRKSNFAGYVSSAEEDAALNGYSSSNGTQVEVSYPPSSGEWSGNSDYVEIRLIRDTPLYFMRAFGKATAPIMARAVAGLVDRNVGIYALASSQAGAVTAASGARVDIGTCEVFVGSDHPEAIVAASGARLEAGRISVVGGYDGAGFFPNPEVGATVSVDPLEDLAPPSFSGCDHSSTVTVDGNTTLHPGVYCGGIDVVNDGDLNLSPGVYVLNGGGLRVGAVCDQQSADDDRDSGRGHDRDRDSDRDSGRGHDRNRDSDRDSGRGHDRNRDSDRDSGHGHDRNRDSDRGSGRGHDRNRDSDRDSGNGRRHASGQATQTDLCQVSQSSGDHDSDRDSDSRGGHTRTGRSPGDAHSRLDRGSDSDRDSASGHGHDRNRNRDSDRDSGRGHANRGSRHSEDEGVSCSPRLRGSGVTFYFTEASGCGYGPLEIDASATIDLSAPTSGSNTGILFHQDRTVSSGRTNVIAGNATSQMTGIGYFPTTDLTLVGPISTSNYETTFIAQSLELQGNISFNCIEADGPLSPSVMRQTALAE